MESATPRQACSIPFILTVHDVKTDAIILSTTIDYESSTTQFIQDTLEQHQTQLGSTLSVSMRTPYFTKFHHAATTSGMSPASVGDHLRAAGFSPETHRIISWYSKIDVCVFGRALHGHSHLIDLTPTVRLSGLNDKYNQPVLQTYNLSHIVKASISLEFQGCGFVYRSLFQTGEPLEMHLPDNDTLAMARIYRLFIQETAVWVM